MTGGPSNSLQHIPLWTPLEDAKPQVLARRRHNIYIEHTRGLSSGWVLDVLVRRCQNLNLLGSMKRTVTVCVCVCLEHGDEPSCANAHS